MTCQSSNRTTIFPFGYPYKPLTVFETQDTSRRIEVTQSLKLDTFQSTLWWLPRGPYQSVSTTPIFGSFDLISNIPWTTLTLKTPLHLYRPEPLINLLTPLPLLDSHYKVFRPNPVDSPTNKRTYTKIRGRDEGPGTPSWRKNPTTLLEDD